MCFLCIVSILFEYSSFTVPNLHMHTQHRAFYLSSLCRSWKCICSVHEQQWIGVTRWSAGTESKCCQCCGHHNTLEFGIKAREGAKENYCSDHPLPLFYPSSLLFLLSPPSPPIPPALLNLAPCVICQLSCWHERFQKRQSEWSRGAVSSLPKKKYFLH